MVSSFAPYVDEEQRKFRVLATRGENILLRKRLKELGKPVPPLPSDQTGDPFEENVLLKQLASQPEPSTFDRTLGRGFGMVGRGLRAAATATNLYQPPEKLPSQVPQDRLKTSQEYARSLLPKDKSGQPYDPRSFGEFLQSPAFESMLPEKVTEPLPPIIQPVVESLTSPANLAAAPLSPVRNTLSVAGAVAAPEVVKRAGGGPVAQTVAGVAGGFAGYPEGPISVAKGLGKKTGQAVEAARQPGAIRQAVDRVSPVGVADAQGLNREAIRRQVVADLKGSPEQGQFVYHVSGSRQIPGIRKEGLKAGGYTSTPLAEEGYGDVVYVFRRSDLSVPDIGAADVTYPQMAAKWKPPKPVAAFSFRELGINKLARGARAEELGAEVEPTLEWIYRGDPEGLARARAEDEAIAIQRDTAVRRAIAEAWGPDFEGVADAATPPRPPAPAAGTITPPQVSSPSTAASVQRAGAAASSPPPPPALPPSPPTGGQPPVPPAGAAGQVPQPQQPGAFLGLEPIRPGLTGKQELLNKLKGTAAAGRVRQSFPSQLVPDDPFSTPAVTKRIEWQANAENVANSIAAEAGHLARQNFDLDDTGRIKSLAGVDSRIPGAPTIPDVAARLPRYWAKLTPGQQQTMTRLRELVDQYGQSLRGLGKDVGTRPDIEQGGFYLPRSVDEELSFGNVQQIRVTGATGAGARSQKVAQWASQAEAIQNGQVYKPFEEELRGTLTALGDEIVDQHVANYFKSVINPKTGKLFAQTAADRIDPGLRAKVETLRSKITSRIDTLSRQSVRLKSAISEERRLSQQVKSYTDLSDNAAQKLESLQLFGSTDEALASADRELAILERELGKAKTRLASAGNRKTSAGFRRFATETELSNLRSEMDAVRGDWETAKRAARALPADQNVIDLPQLQGYSFPTEMANAVNKVLKDELKTPGLLKSIDAQLVGLQTTLDNSGVGIQSMLGLARRPAAWKKAMAVNLKAWAKNGEKVLGAHIASFNEKAKQAGTLTSDQWGRYSLNITPVDTEFAVRGTIANAPLIRNANRAFAYLGTALRLEWADEMLKQELRKGRTLQEIIDSGDINQIVRAANSGTGRAAVPFAGGKVPLFAPRFLQARIDVLTDTLRGLGPGNTLAHREARGALLRYVGYATLLTVLINEAQGRDTDVRPWVNGRYNSNFMRARVGNYDFSLLGTYESLFRAIALTLMGKPHEAYRNLSSPSVSIAWDLAAGEDAIGRGTRDNPEQFARFLASQAIPFSFTEIPGEAYDVASTTSTAGERLAGATAAVGQAFGAKVSPLSPKDKKDNLAQELYGRPYDDTSEKQREVIKDRMAKEEPVSVSAGLVTEPAKLDDLARKMYFDDYEGLYEGQKLNVLSQLMYGRKFSTLNTSQRNKVRARLPNAAPAGFQGLGR